MVFARVCGVRVRVGAGPGAGSRREMCSAALPGWGAPPEPRCQVGQTSNSASIRFNWCLAMARLARLASRTR